MWPRLTSTALGIWLMMAPAVLGYSDPARTNDVVVGPIVASVAVVASSEVMRALRWVNLMPGVWLLAAPWILGYAGTAAVNSMAAGALIITLACVRGMLHRRFGGGWRSLLSGGTSRR